MSTILPVNLDDLLHQRSVESARVEFKASWNEITGKQVLKTVCAFANDHQNLNGGYVVLGVAEQGGQAVLPPVGLRAEDIERAQKWLRGQCRAMDPPYDPIFSPELVEDRHILVGCQRIQSMPLFQPYRMQPISAPLGVPERPSTECRELGKQMKHPQSWRSR